VLRRVSHSVKILCEGEVNQIFERGNIHLNIKRHLVILKKKTAVLFSAAASSGALMAKANRDQMFGMHHIGTALGMLFQITDDYLDVLGTEQDLGKAIGQDISMGDITLPILLLIQSLPQDQAGLIIQRLSQKDALVLPMLQSQLKGSVALAQMQDLAVLYRDRVTSILDQFPSSKYRDHVALIAKTIYRRAW
jgi:geranylgeranyl pyrophosphate synthase